MELFFNLTSLIIAVTSLIISLIALKISKEFLRYSSREYVPHIDWNIDDKDVLALHNKSDKLFTLLQIAFIKINFFGFEEPSVRLTTKIPFITISQMRNDLQNQSKVLITRNNAFACAYVCPYPQEKVNYVKNKIAGFKKYNESKKYIPSLQSVTYLVEIVYSNKFKETKTMYCMKKHFHGSGYHHTQIQQEEFFNILHHADIPKIDDDEELWDFVGSKYSFKW